MSAVRHGRCEERGADHPLILHRKHLCIVGELCEHGAHHGQATGVRRVEDGVPVGQQRVTHHGGGAQDGRVGLAKHPWLAAFRVVVRVAAEKGREGAGLVPARKQLCPRLTEKTAHV